MIYSIFKAPISNYLSISAAQITGFLVLVLFVSACGGGGGSKQTKTNPEQFDLTLVVAGSGTINSSASAASCSSQCVSSIDENSAVTLTATAAAGFIFEQWTGDCSGTAPCSIVMNSNKTVTASFVPDNNNPDYTLDVVINGLGTVVSTPMGIDCGSDCSETYISNSQVNLIATPASGYRFSHWAGDCSGNLGCNLTFTQDRNVTAVFVVESDQSGILIGNYSPPNDAFQLAEISTNASGITWHEGLQQYLVVRNGSASIFRYDRNFAYIGQLQVSGINQDTEGLGFVGGNEVLVVNEGNFAHKLLIEEFTTAINGDPNQTQAYRLLPPAPSNKGLEGVAVRKANGNQLARAFACQEGSGADSNALMKVVYFDIPAVDPLVVLSYDDNLTVVEPFDAEVVFAGAVTDIAGMVYDDRTGHLIIVSQESRKAIQVDPLSGEIISQLSLSGAPQFEGVTLGPDGELVFVSEGNWIRIYTLN